MNKLWALLRVQLMGAFGFNKVLHSKDKKEKRKFIAFSALMVYATIAILFSLVFYEYIFIDTFTKAGVPRLMPALMMTAASLITLVTTIYKANGLIFGFKDFDMTMAMPVKTSVVVASRLIMLYLMNLGFCLPITVTSSIVYSLFTATPVVFFPFMLILTLFIPLIPMLIGTALGSIVTAVSSKFRHAGVINIVFTLAVVIAVIVFSTRLQTMIFNSVLASADIMKAVYGINPLAYLYIDALCDGNVLSLMIFAGISAAFFMVLVLVLGKFYKSINTALTTGRARSNYRVTSLKVSSAISALYRRELRRYFSSPLYVLNTGIGMVITLLIGVSLLFFKPEQLEQMLEIPGFANILGTFAPLVLSTTVCLSCTTASSVSLEGASLWIVKSLPVTPDIIFKSKLLLNLTVTVPLSLVSALFIAAALPISALQILFLFLTPAVFAILSAEFGLYINLLRPNFEWTSEVAVIKQSMPVFISVIGGTAVPILLIVGLSQLPVSLQTAGSAAVTVAAFLASAFIYRLLNTKGARLFKAL